MAASSTSVSGPLGVRTLVSIAARTPSGATRSAETDRMCGGRPTLTGGPPDAPSTHTLGLRPDEPATHRLSLRSQLTDAIDTPLIRLCSARAAGLACGFAAADSELVYSVVPAPPMPAR